MTELLKQTNRTIGEFLHDRGLGETDIRELHEIMRDELECFDRGTVAIDPNVRVSEILLPQAAYIGRAIARVTGSEFVDDDRELSLTEPENAMHYGLQQIELFLKEYWLFPARQLVFNDLLQPCYLAVLRSDQLFIQLLLPGN